MEGNTSSGMSERHVLSVHLSVWFSEARRGEVLGLPRLRVQKSQAECLFAACEDGERAVHAVEGSSRSPISPNR